MSAAGGEVAPQVTDLRREEMLRPDEVAAMLRLRSLGWGATLIAAEFGCSRNTVKRYLARGAWAPCRQRRRAGVLDALKNWLAERFRGRTRGRGHRIALRGWLLPA